MMIMSFCIVKSPIPVIFLRNESVKYRKILHSSIIKSELRISKMKDWL